MWYAVHSTQCMYVCAHMSMHAHKHMCRHTSTHMHTCTHAHTHTHTHTHTQLKYPQITVKTNKLKFTTYFPIAPHKSLMLFPLIPIVVSSIKTFIVGLAVPVYSIWENYNIHESHHNTSCLIHYDNTTYR